MSKSRKALLAAAVVFLLMAALTVICAITVFADSAKDKYYVNIFDGDSTTTVQTHSSHPEEILNQAGVRLTVLDSIDVGKFVPGEDSSITVERPSLVGVERSAGTVFFTFDGTVADAIEMAELTMDEGDTANYDVNSSVKDGMIISVSKAQSTGVSYHGSLKTVEAAGGTVGEVLEKAGIEVSKNDVVSDDLDEKTQDGMVVFVDEVKYETRKETEPIKYKTVTKEDPSLNEGTRKVTVEGENGVKTYTYKDKYVNGKKIDSVLEDTSVTKEPIDEVITVGTRVITNAYNVKAATKPISNLGTVPLDSNGIPLSYTGVISGKATAYQGGWGTASGLPAQVGHVAVDPSIIPYGTKLYIIATDGTVYGYAIAADTGTFIERGDIVVDVYMNSYQESCNWGLKEVNMYILP